MNDTCVVCKAPATATATDEWLTHIRAPVPTVPQLTGMGAPNAGRRSGLARTPAGQYRRMAPTFSH